MTEPTPALTLDTIVVRQEEILTAALSETELVMLHMDKGAYYGVEEVAKFIWDMLAHPITVAAISSAVAARYPDVDAATCQRDALAFLADMLQEEMIVVYDHAPAA